MNLQAIMVANITGFLILFFLFFSRFITRTKSDLEEHAFDVMMYLVMIALIVEPLGFAIDGIHSTVCYWINLIGATYLYFANGTGIFLWLMYVDLKLFHDRSRMEKIYYKLSIPVALLLLSLIGNLKFKYYFYIDENYIYHRQPTVYIFYFYMLIRGRVAVKDISDLHVLRRLISDHIYGRVLVIAFQILIALF